MFSTKSFAIAAICMLVLIQFIECGEKGDTIILGHHCGPKFLLNDKGKGSTLVMGGHDCHKKKEHYHHYQHHYEPHYEEKHEEHYGYDHGYGHGM
ncbi:hypothetical protein RDWZM_007108 [Blomia tropicalis]|uniref:Uncharacterized protein n=1 Tax=Blomia tropicalis TaxID=40697 RepID=A0A9Q0M8H9_BLOTA|nr:hypothetical protein RDWZM_007108 [Blomia tropicalis]